MNPSLPSLTAALTGIQVGAAIVASRWLVDDLGPIPLAFLRYAIGAIALVPFAIGLRSKLLRADLAPIALLGIGQFGVTIVLLNFALEVIPASRAALLFATTPLMAMLVERVLEARSLGLVRGVAVLLTIAGVAVAVSERPFEAGQRAWLGDLAVLGSAFTAAACSVMYRPYLRRYPATLVGSVAMSASAIALLAAAIAVGRPSAVPLALDQWAVMVFLGTSSGLGYFMWLWSLSKLRSTEVTMFLALSPLTAAVLGTVLLGEALTVRLLIGLVLVAAGLWLAPRSSDR